MFRAWGPGAMVRSDGASWRTVGPDQRGIATALEDEVHLPATEMEQLARGRGLPERVRGAMASAAATEQESSSPRPRPRIKASALRCSSIMSRSRWGSGVGNEDESGWRGDTDGIASARSTVVKETNSGTSWSLGTVMRGISSIGHDPSRPGACPSLTSCHLSTQCTHGPEHRPGVLPARAVHARQRSWRPYVRSDPGAEAAQCAPSGRLAGRGPETRQPRPLSCRGESRGGDDTGR